MSNKIFGISIGTILIVCGALVIGRMYGARIPILNNL